MSTVEQLHVLRDAKRCNKVEGCTTMIAFVPGGRGRPICLEAHALVPGAMYGTDLELYVVTNNRAMRVTSASPEFWQAPLFVNHTSRPGHQHLSKSGFVGKTDERYDREDWVPLRVRCFDRDGYACRVCGRTQAELVALGLSLEAHHTSYETFGHGGDVELAHLETRCTDCHAEEPR